MATVARVRVEITTDAAEFQARTSAFLLRDPLRHTVITTAVANQLQGLVRSAEPSYFVSVHGGDDMVLGAAIRSAGHEVYLGELPSRGVDSVAEALAGVVPEAGGVEGAVGAVEVFAARWGVLLERAYRRAYGVRLFRLGTLVTPRVLRADGRDVCLFTDLANPTSNKIYPAIGFEPVRDFAHYEFS